MLISSNLHKKSYEVFIKTCSPPGLIFHSKARQLSTKIGRDHSHGQTKIYRCRRQLCNLLSGDYFILANSFYFKFHLFFIRQPQKYEIHSCRCFKIKLAEISLRIRSHSDCRYFSERGINGTAKEECFKCLGH